MSNYHLLLKFVSKYKRLAFFVCVISIIAAILESVGFSLVLPIVNDSETEAFQNYIFEPSMEQIVSELVPKSLKIQLFKALRDSFASEHGARMTAMHKATDNATELKDELVLTYNKARQAAITNEILEIVSGAEALKG